MTALGESVPVTETHDEHLATVAAMVALDHLVAADARDDEPAVRQCLEKLMRGFVYRPVPGAMPTGLLPASRMTVLCAILVRQTADLLTVDDSRDEPREYGIRTTVGDRAWDDLDPPDQVALGAVVTAMNGEWNDAHQLLYRFALGTGPAAMTQTFVTLLAMRRRARDQRPTPL
jgi:hypothetical protein